MAPPPPPSHHCNPFSLHFHFHPQMQDPILSFSFIILFIIALSFTLLSFSVHKRSSQNPHNKHPQSGLTRNPENSDPEILSQFVDEAHRPAEDNPTRSLLRELLPSDSEKWATSFDDGGCDDPNSNSSDPGGKKKKRKEKKKRKGKKKKMNSAAEDDAQEKRGGDRETSGSDFGTRPESACLCPFTSSSSAMQRKIKQHYDELVKCNESKKLTLAQVVQFANSLVDARSELQHKADVIQRKFVITKALLCKAERSSFDRLRQQIYKLELEQKRLEEDASVYNWLQQQLKLSPAYKKMLEIGASMEKAKSCELGEKRDDEFADISFEELLAQEKKDSFWKKKGKSSLCSS